MRRDAILACEGPNYTCSQHGELLADRWSEHESAFKSVKARGFKISMLAHDKQEMCVLALCECVLTCIYSYIHVCVLHCAFNICSSVDSRTCIQEWMCVVACACVSVFGCLLGTESAECHWNENKCGFAMATDECQSRRERRN